MKAEADKNQETAALDVSAIRAFMQKKKLISANMPRDQRKAVIVPVLKSIRPLFGKDSVGFRTYLILCEQAEIPPDIESMEKAAHMYLRDKT